MEEGENQTIEFKLKANHPDKIVRELVAFANAEGGVLLVGVSDEGRIEGLKYPEDEAYVLEAAIHKYTMPLPSYRFEIAKAGFGRKVLLCYVEQGDKKPYYYLHDTKNKIGKPIIRYKDMSITASKEWRKILNLRNKQRELTLRYGHKEQRILSCFKEHNAIAFQDLYKQTKLKKSDLSYTLVKLVYCNILELEPREGGDLYIMKENSN